MRFYKPPKIYVQGFWLSMPFITFALCYIMYGQRMFNEWKPWVLGYGIIYTIGFVSWYCHAQYDQWMRRKLPSLEQTGKRVLYKLVVNLLIMTPSILLIFFVFDKLHVAGYSLGEKDLQYGYLVGLSVNLLFETLWEVLFILDKYKESLSEKEKVEKMAIEQEFENLKSQVNPHFLFNCFNTLSSLIAEDKKRAEKFLNELSKVYRYLLSSNEEGMTTLDSEIKFIASYYQLLKTRHGEAVELQIEVDKKYYPYLLPSLSLQLLVENAVKHNVLSKNYPLVIEIFTTSGKQLVVNNNLQRRQQKPKSAGVGLNNIMAKYKLINQEGFQVVEGDKNFMAVLPLVWNKQAAQEAEEITERDEFI
jgi:two-component system, LytTR family, sensor kinase